MWEHAHTQLNLTSILEPMFKEVRSESSSLPVAQGCGGMHLGVHAVQRLELAQLPFGCAALPRLKLEFPTVMAPLQSHGRCSHPSQDAPLL